MNGRIRWLVVVLELALLSVYVLAFGVFAGQSRDFIVARNNQRAISAARAMDATIPIVLEFGPSRPARALLGAGWWLDDQSAAGVWSRSRSFVFMPVPAGSAGDLVVDGEAFLAPSHAEVQIALSVDGMEFGNWAARYGEPPPQMVVSLPASVSSDGLLELRFDVRSPAVPFHHGIEDDKRSIGFLLRALSMQSSGGPSTR